MKEELKHRIDALMEKAKAGDTSAQLKLAKEFNKGSLVEKSLDNARYWAYRAVSGGNISAISFYNSIASEYHTSVSEKVDNVLRYCKWLPWIEFIGSILLLVILPDDITPYSVLAWFLCVGLASLVLMSLVSIALNKWFNLTLNKGISITIIVVHIIGIIIACL